MAKTLTSPGAIQAKARIALATHSTSGDQCEALPGGVIAHPGAEASLRVLDPGSRLQAVKVGQAEDERSSPESIPSRRAGSSTSR